MSDPKRAIADATLDLPALANSAAESSFGVPQAGQSDMALPSLALAPAGGTLVDEPINVAELEGLKILSGVGGEILSDLTVRKALRILEPGDLLISRGQTHRTMFLVLSGRLSIHLERLTSEPVTYVEAGQSVGEMSVLDESPASAWVLAVDSTRVLALNEEAFWRLVSASHAFAMNLLMVLADRMRVNNSALSEGARQRRQLERDALLDKLTGCHNRRWIEDRLPRLVSRHERSGQPLSLLIVDIDFFKRFNDEFGHQAGDEVLGVMGRILSEGLRPTDLAARYGGEEFLVFLPDTPLAGALVAAERLRARVAGTPITLENGRLLPPVTASIGVAQLAGGEDPAALVARADAGLYRAKHAGRNRVVSSSEKT